MLRAWLIVCCAQLSGRIQCHLYILVLLYRMSLGVFKKNLKAIHCGVGRQNTSYDRSGNSRNGLLFSSQNQKYNKTHSGRNPFKYHVVVVVVSHIQRIGCQPEKTTLHGGQSRSWSAEQGKENKRKSLAAYPPPPTPHTARSEKINKITRRIYRRYAGGRSRVRTRIPSARRLGLWVWLRKILHSRLR